MANALFDPGREGFLSGQINWGTSVVGVYLVRGYTFSAAHKFISDVTGAGGVLVSGPITLASQAFTNGVASAANAIFPAVAAGAACPAIIIAQRSAVGGGADVADSAKRLIAYIDTATGLPVTPNGGDIDVSWDTGANKIFKL